VFDQLVQFLQDLILSIGYPGVFVVMFTENLFPPIPTDPLLPFAGILVADGQFSFLIVWICAVAGAMTGTMLLYGIGAWADDHVIRRFIRRYGKWIGLSESQLDRAFALFDRYGAWFILIGRSIPVIRSAVSLTAGMSGMSIPKFLLLSTINSTVITGFWIAAGVLLGENWRTIFDALNESPWLMVIGIALVVVGVIVYRRHRRTQHMQEAFPPAEETYPH
jgi:membrane protein DedA with SNARE-associated domain